MSDTEHREISDELIAQVNFNEANFLTNEQLGAAHEPDEDDVIDPVDEEEALA